MDGFDVWIDLQCFADTADGLRLPDIVAIGLTDQRLQILSVIMGKYVVQILVNNTKN